MLRDKITEIFVQCDDFCLEFEQELKTHIIENKKVKTRNRKASLSDSELMTLLITFHLGQFSNLKAFYCMYALPHLNDLFPGLVSYIALLSYKKE